MKLHSIRICGYKRIEDSTFFFGDTTFLIGPNNVGKSSVLSAIEELFSANEKLDEYCYHSKLDDITGDNIQIKNEVVLEAELRDVPREAENWKGFKGRIIPYEPLDSSESGLSIIYRKHYPVNGKCCREMKTFKRILKPELASAKTPADLIQKGMPENSVTSIFPDISRKIPKILDALDELNEAWDIDCANQEWALNPGGFHSLVAHRLPLFIVIPAEYSPNELDAKKGGLATIMTQLFKEIKETSINFSEAQRYLSLLEKELDPSDVTSSFGEMMCDLNKVMNSIFPNTKIHANANLSNPETSIVPQFDINMSSNVKTPVLHQGTGMVRSAIFALIKFRNEWFQKKGRQPNKNIFIAFEEPELYLHPNAANQMRDTIYNLSEDSSQIVCTTHSTYMIDLARKPRQVLNSMSFFNDTIQSTAFSLSDAFKNLSDSDRTYVKMILKMDDYCSRVFFAKKVIVVEGDTEDIILRETFQRLPQHIKELVYSEVQILKARGKGAIIPIIKYLKSFKINFFVIHDRDSSILKAEQFNQPIEDAMGSIDNIVMLRENIEDCLGCPHKQNDKPYNAYHFAQQWGDGWDSIPKKWRMVIEKVLHEYFRN